MTLARTLSNKNTLASVLRHGDFGTTEDITHVPCHGNRLGLCFFLVCRSCSYFCLVVCTHWESLWFFWRTMSAVCGSKASNHGPRGLKECESYVYTFSFAFFSHGNEYYEGQEQQHHHHHDKNIHFASARQGERAPRG
jgi:hypothetical protein